MGAVSFPYLQKRGRTYRFRMRVPDRLAARLGRRELLQSFGAIDAPQARRRALRAAVLAHRFVEEAEALPQDGQAVVDDAWADFQVRLRSLVDLPPHEIWTANLDHELLRPSMNGSDRPTVCPKPAAGPGVSGTPAPSCDATAPVVQRTSQMPAQDSRDPRCILTASELLPDFWLERTENAERTRGDYATSLRYLDQLSGGKPVGELTTADIRAFKDGLLRAPRSFRQKLGTDNIVEAIRQNESRNLPTIDPRTIREKYLSNVKTFIRWCADSGIVAGDIAKTVTVAAPKGRNGGRRKRHPFSQLHIERMLAAPLFATCRGSNRILEPGPVAVRDHRFWAPLLALFTGMRSNEIGQLTVNSLERHHDRWFLRVTEAPDPDDPDLDARDLKNAPSERLIPLHGKLAAVGFPDYVADIKAEGRVRLFPAWEPDSKGFYSGTMSKWFNRTLLGGLEMKSPTLSFHSFRHTFKDALKRAGIGDEDRKILMGHAANSVSEGYGSRTLFAVTLERFDAQAFSEIGACHIRYLKKRVCGGGPEGHVGPGSIATRG